MKKILSLLSTISLSTIITTNIVACQQPNTNIENNKPTEPQFTPQQPPKGSNWKLVKNNYMKRDTGWYIVIHKSSNLWKIEKIDSSKKYGTRFFSDIVYKWELNNEPTTPTINNNTGEITDWNEKIES